MVLKPPGAQWHSGVDPLAPAFEGLTWTSWFGLQFWRRWCSVGKLSQAVISGGLGRSLPQFLMISISWEGWERLEGPLTPVCEV